MERNTKILIGVATAGVVGYIVYKSSKPKNTKDQYLCPEGYKLTPYPMGRLVGEICKDSKGKTAEKQPNPNYVGTKEPECICDSYPCNCGGSKPDYGYGNPRMSGTCPEGYTYNSLAGCIPYVMTE
jgi:hypothetical protein